MGLKFTSNSTARFSSVASIDWDNVTGKPASIAGLPDLPNAGLIAATDLTGDFAGRTITGTANEISVANGDGVAANPTLSLPSALTFTGKTITGGTYASVVSINGNFWTAGTGTLTIAAGKTATFSNTLRFVGTDSTVLTFPTTSATIARTDAGQTFTGTNVFGVLTATSVNGNTFTTGTYTLTGGAGKTLTFSNTLTLAGTDSTTMTFPVGSGAVQTADSTGVFTNKTFDTAGTGNVFKINGVTISANTGTGNNVLATTPTITTPNIVGSTTNDSAAAGSVAEEIITRVLVSSAIGLTSTANTNIATATLTPGDYDASGVVSFTGPATTTLTFATASLSTTSATPDTTPERSNAQFYNSLTVFANINPAQPIGPTRFSVSTTTTIFLVGRANFATSTCSAFGTIRARRER